MICMRWPIPMSMQRFVQNLVNLKLSWFLPNHLYTDDKLYISVFRLEVYYLLPCANISKSVCNCLHSTMVDLSDPSSPHNIITFVEYFLCLLLSSFCVSYVKSIYLSSGISFSGSPIRQQRKTRQRNSIAYTDEESWLDTGLLLEIVIRTFGYTLLTKGWVFHEKF